jgi:hypothetical protein
MSKAGDQHFEIKFAKDSHELLSHIILNGLQLKCKIKKEYKIGNQQMM